jgi:hypothetical protein
MADTCYNLIGIDGINNKLSHYNTLRSFLPLTSQGASCTCGIGMVLFGIRLLYAKFVLKLGDFPTSNWLNALQKKSQSLMC